VIAIVTAIGILAELTDESHLSPLPGGSHGLIATLAAKAFGQITGNHRLARSGQMFHPRREVHIEGTNHDN
jgi:hypothetical protein